MSYEQRLRRTEKEYPFDLWAERFQDGLEQYTDENNTAARRIMDNLLQALLELGEGATEKVKVKQFEVAVESLNYLNDTVGGDLIETAEREELCDLFDAIAVAAGIDPENYGDGEGIASEWRDW
ncbi:hypothetical protein [Hahella sp. HN01]|uniref:hypothetical protein n=1 Tax=Hahella sp. HN01 TaxID=2847262 RepID=UPI001C1EFEE4|nr:hypothetical protein [Hahella sp. HN01]MBU6954229.1 hypothetical protein [Hahella sp. HN01]